MPLGVPQMASPTNAFLTLSSCLVYSNRARNACPGLDCWRTARTADCCVQWTRQWALAPLSSATSAHWRCNSDDKQYSILDQGLLDATGKHRPGNSMPLCGLWGCCSQPYRYEWIGRGCVHRCKQQQQDGKPYLAWYATLHQDQSTSTLVHLC